jgi:hypothetical protein
MRRASVLAALIVSVFAVQSASAAVIGVRGVDSGSEDATDGGAFELTACNVTADDVEILTEFFCVVYFNDTDADLYAVDLAFWDVNGDPILAIGGEFIFNFEVDKDESDFQLIRFFPNDPYLVRLCTDEVAAGILACGGDFGSDPVILAGTWFVVFADFQGFVSIQGWNEGENENRAARGEPLQIPEPATLLLLGLGLATAAGRRLRHRRG